MAGRVAEQLGEIAAAEMSQICEGVERYVLGEVAVEVEHRAAYRRFFDSRAACHVTAEHLDYQAFDNMTGKISHFIAALTGNDSISDADEQELMDYIQKM